MAHAAKKGLKQPGADRPGLLGVRRPRGSLACAPRRFALKAISREMDELGMIPAATQAAWRKNRLSNDKRILELVTLAVDSKGLVNVWRRELAWVFGMWGSSYRMHSRLIVAGRPGTGYSCGADAVGSGSRACPHTTGGRLDSVGFKTETFYVQAGDDDVVDIHRGYSRGGDGKVDTT